MLHDWVFHEGGFSCKGMFTARMFSSRYVSFQLPGNVLCQTQDVSHVRELLNQGCFDLGRFCVGNPIYYKNLLFACTFQMKNL